MVFSTPSLNDLIRITENGFSNAFFGEASVLRKSVLKVLARVFAGVAFLVVLLLQKMWKNSFLTTCDVESLKDYGDDFDLPNKPESYSKGAVIVKTDGAVVTLPQGTIVVTSEGVEYETVSDMSLVGAENGTSVNVIAVDSGEGCDIPEGTTLQFRDGTPDHVEASVVVSSGGVTGGKKISVEVNGSVEYWGEEVEEYRVRLLNYRRTQPSGGCSADYKGWAERFDCVSRCIVDQNYPETNSVTCVLACFRDNSDSVALNSTNVSEVESYVTDDVRRPITADVRVVSCTDKPIDFVVSISPDSVNTRDRVRYALKYVLRGYKPGNTVTKEDIAVGLKTFSDIGSVVVISVDGGSSVTLSRANHELPVIGSMTVESV